MTDNYKRPRCGLGRQMAARAAEQQTRTLAPVTVENVADYILTEFDRGPEYIITITRLQGLLFRAQGHHLARFGTPLFPEEIHKINFMPAVPEIEARYREQAENTCERYGKYFHCFPKNRDIHFTPEIQEFLREIWDTYGTHKETVSGLYMKVAKGRWEGAYYPAGVMCLETMTRQFSTTH